MARLACAFLALVLAYQCVAVVNGAADENSLPSFVKNKHSVFEGLKSVCQRTYGTRVVGRADLPNCKVYCARGLFNGLFRKSDVTLNNQEPCSNQGGVCVDGQCVHYA
uniref:Putative secreted protein n=2 Tax=Ixodes ricinus TaxID=34613 RepID=V5HFK2_IXORI